MPTIGPTVPKVVPDVLLPGVPVLDEPNAEFEPVLEPNPPLGPNPVPGVEPIGELVEPNPELPEPKLELVEPGPELAEPMPELFESNIELPEVVPPGVADVPVAGLDPSPLLATGTPLASVDAGAAAYIEPPIPPTPAAAATPATADIGCPKNPRGRTWAWPNSTGFQSSLPVSGSV